MAQMLYRKWRPKRLVDVVGQEHITRTLSNAVRLDRIAHAYLFCGPKGTGKTSTARILANLVNCVDVIISNKIVMKRLVAYARLRIFILIFLI